MIREKLIENIKAEINPNEPVALSFSGGTDSLCLLFCCFDLGIKPTLYTYTVKGYVSPDLKIAQDVAQKYGLQLNVAEIPEDLPSILADVKKMISDDITGKVAIQCMHGHYYVAPLVKEKQILNGSGIDGIYGVYKSTAIKGRKDKAMFDKIRNKNLANPNDDAMVYQSDLFKKFGVKVLYPYRKQNILTYLMGLSYSQINKPKLKQVTIQEFPEITPYWRPRGSQQIMAGTRALHEKLMQTKYAKGLKRVNGVYKCIEKEIRGK